MRLTAALCAVVANLGLSASTIAVAEAPFYEDKTRLLFLIDDQGVTKPVKTVADWEKRRVHVLENAQLVMGVLPDRANKVPLDMQVIDETDCGGFIRMHVTFAVEAGDRLPAYLCVPKSIQGKAAAVLCLHPTFKGGKDSPVGLGGLIHRHYARELAARGYVTLAPDYPGFGEYVKARAALYARGYASATAKGIWNHMRGVDLLQSLSYVDGDRIGCIGHSLGGHNTLFLGMFDPRVKVMVTSCGFTSFTKYKNGDLTGWTHDGYMPRIASVYGKDPRRIPFDFGEVLGALAPRAVFICAPKADDNFDMGGVDDCVAAARPVFSLYGTDDQLMVAHPEGGHDFPDETRQQAYSFIDKIIGGK